MTFRAFFMLSETTESDNCSSRGMICENLGDFLTSDSGSFQTLTLKLEVAGVYCLTRHSLLPGPTLCARAFSLSSYRFRNHVMLLYPVLTLAEASCGKLT